MKLSSYMNYHLSSVDDSPKHKEEIGVVITNDDIEESLFDMTDNGIYLYYIYPQKFGGDFTSFLPAKVPIDGVDIT